MKIELPFVDTYQTFRGIIVELRWDGTWRMTKWDKDEERPSAFEAYFGTRITYLPKRSIVSFRGELKDQCRTSFQQCLFSRRNRTLLPVQEP